MQIMRTPDEMRQFIEENKVNWKPYFKKVQNSDVTGCICVLRNKKTGELERVGLSLVHPNDQTKINWGEGKTIAFYRALSGEPIFNRYRDLAPDLCNLYDVVTRNVDIKDRAYNPDELMWCIDVEIDAFYREIENMEAANAE